MELLIKSALGAATKVPGTAVFLTAQPHGVPHALLHNFEHNKVLHERSSLMPALGRKHTLGPMSGMGGKRTLAQMRSRTANASMKTSPTTINAATVAAVRKLAEVPSSSRSAARAFTPQRTRNPVMPATIATPASIAPKCCSFAR